jgi:4'-phosphopantetheinyl transferase
VALVSEHDARVLSLPAPAPGVDAWLCELARARAEIESLATTLSDVERSRAGRFGRIELRDRYVVGRATLRQILARILDHPPAEVPIARGHRGRPYVEHPNARDLDFNVSHTRGVALIAVTRGRRIGVDIEHGQRAVNVDGIARKFMSERERTALDGMWHDARRRALLRLWTCKEAMSKATGDALSAPFRDLDIDVRASLRLVHGPAPYTPERWVLVPVDVPGGYLATCALWHEQDPSQGP